MITVKKEITKEEYDKAKTADDPYVLISQDIQMGYGAYGARIFEEDGKYFLKYDRGDSCD